MSKSEKNEGLAHTLAAAADAALKAVLGDDYDPNWRDQLFPVSPSPPPTLERILELNDLYRQSTTPFLSNACRIEKSRSRTNHFRGGRLKPNSPKCGVCGATLVLFADLDATDELLQGTHGLKRLPLLYCCSCTGPVYYLISRSGRVSVIPSQPEPYEECPFTDRFQEIPRGYVKLKQIGAELDRTIVAAFTSEGFAGLTTSDKRRISQMLGRTPDGRWDMYFSQIGGYPHSYQGEEGKPDTCPNTKCSFRRKRRQEFKYRPLAVLDLWCDKFWGLNKDALQIVYHICPGCMCISAKYTCT